MQKTGRLVQLKLEHESGFLKCSEESFRSYWGCNNEPGSYTSDIIGTLVTDDQNNVLMQQTKIPGYTGMSPYIVFNKDAQNAPVVSSLPCQLRIWYNEDFSNTSEYDNSGYHSVKVYATVAEEY